MPTLIKREESLCHLFPCTANGRPWNHHHGHYCYVIHFSSLPRHSTTWDASHRPTMPTRLSHVDQWCRPIVAESDSHEGDPVTPVRSGSVGGSRSDSDRCAPISMVTQCSLSHERYRSNRASKRRPDCLPRDDSNDTGGSNPNTSLRCMASRAQSPRLDGRIDGESPCGSWGNVMPGPDETGQPSTHSTTIWGAEEKMPWSQAIYVSECDPYTVITWRTSIAACKNNIFDAHLLSLLSSFLSDEEMLNIRSVMI